MAFVMLHTHDLGIYASERKYTHLEGVVAHVWEKETVLFPFLRATRPKRGQKRGRNATKLF